MADFPDLQLRHAPRSDDVRTGVATHVIFDDALARSERSKWIVLILLIGIGVGILGYVIVQRAKPKTTVAAPVSAPAPAPAPPAKQGRLVEAENIALPPLAEMDALLRQLVVKLSSHPKVLAWLMTNGLIDNFAVATLNVSEGKSPVMHWRSLAPQARFGVINSTDGVLIDPKSYRRYDEYAAAIGALDAPSTARLYLTVKPRITEAYRALGFPEGDFDLVLERAMHELVTTPLIEKDIVLKEKVITYKFDDPTVESLTAAQKQLLRMGPNNMRVVQAKLREIATQLALHP